MRINFIGDIYCDVLADGLKALPEWQTDSLARISFMAGGSCLNSIVHAKAYINHFITAKTCEVDIFSAVGNDSQGDICLKTLKTMDISIDNICINSRNTGTCIVLSGENDRCFISDRGCIEYMSLNWFDFTSLQNCNHLHFGGFYNCSALRNECLSLFKQFRHMNITTSLNPQYDANNVWDGIVEIAPYLSIIIGNSDEINAIAKKQSYNQSANEILNWGCKLVVVTLGSGGAIAFEMKENLMCETPCNSLRIESIIDTTGCGDAFIGGFLVEWLQTDQDIVEALKAGVLCGAAATQSIGGSTTDAHIMLELQKYNSNN